jgi:predicted RNA-binding protein with TRAM domain
MPYERRGFRRFGPRADIPKPVKVGEEYDVEISEVGSKGDGIARVKNFVVFVANGKKGEKAHIKITEVMNRFAIGEKTGEAGEVSEEPSKEAEEKEETEEAAEEEATEEKTEEAEEPEAEETLEEETEEVEEVE